MTGVVCVPTCVYGWACVSILELIVFLESMSFYFSSNFDVHLIFLQIFFYPSSTLTPLSFIHMLDYLLISISHWGSVLTLFSIFPSPCFILWIDYLIISLGLLIFSFVASNLLLILSSEILTSNIFSYLKLHLITFISPLTFDYVHHLL